MKKLIIVLCCLFFGCVSMEKRSRFSDEEITAVKISESKTINTKLSEAVTLNIDTDFGNDVLIMNSLIDTIYFIPLETTEQSIFNGISEVFVTDNRIFICDNNREMLIFKFDGRFVSKLTRGQGPGEVTGVFDFTYDDVNNQLIVYDQTDCLKFYDINGKYLYDKKMPFMFHDFCTCDDGYVFFQPIFLNRHLGDEACYAIFKTDKQFEIKCKGVSVSNSILTMQPPFIMKARNKIMIAPLANDTIFEVSSSIEARYVLKYDNHKADDSDIDHLKISEKYYQCSGYFENSRTQLFNFWSYKKGSYYVFRDKNTGKTIGGEHLACSPDSIPPLFHVKFVYNDFFVTEIEPWKEMRFASDAVSEADNKQIEDLTEEDNNVLVFFKYKNLK